LKKPTRKKKITLANNKFVLIIIVRRLGINVNEIDQWFKSDYMLDGYDNKRAIESKELNIERKEHGIEDEHYIEDDS